MKLSFQIKGKQIQATHSERHGQFNDTAVVLAEFSLELPSLPVKELWKVAYL